MTTEESAMPVDRRPYSQGASAFAELPKCGTISPDSSNAGDIQPEASVMQLSAVLIIILAGMSTTFVLAAIILSSAAHG